jgi:hypothetical protein
LAAAALRVTEVGSVERVRIHGESNLRAVRDGLRVLRTIRAERRRARTSRDVRQAELVSGEPRVDTAEQPVMSQPRVDRARAAS